MVVWGGGRVSSWGWGWLNSTKRKISLLVCLLTGKAVWLYITHSNDLKEEVPVEKLYTCGGGGVFRRVHVACVRCLVQNETLIICCYAVKI